MGEGICDKGDKGRKDADKWENWWVKEFVIKVIRVGKVLASEKTDGWKSLW